MRHPLTFLMLFAAATTAYSKPKTVGTAVLADAPLITAGDEINVEGVGTLRGLGSSPMDSVRVFHDGEQRVLVLRISTGGAATARLLIRNMALPEGAELYLYGRDESGTAGKSYGPFTATGPLSSGEFWTDAVAGSEIVLELQADSLPMGNLPFQVVGFTVADVAEAIVSGQPESGTEEVRTSLFRGNALTHSVKDGWAIYEGDIILGTVDELPPVSLSRKGRRDSVAITGSQYRWPGGIIPYRIDAAVPNQTRITAAIDHWNTSLAGHVKLIPRTSETAYVNFVRAPSASSCSSNVGRLGYAQGVNVGDYCTTGNMIHEIGHAAGLWHEQGREDRNSYVQILWENVQSGYEHNFNQQITDGDDIGSYNYGSVMHYPAKAFSSNGLATIQTIPAGISIGQRSGLNTGDIAGLKIMYPSLAVAPGTSTVAVTIATNPNGMPVALDGIVGVAPVTVNWVPGSVHSIAALNSTPVNGTSNTFSRWSDGGAATHQISVSTSNTTLRADYVTSYLLSTTAAPVGTVTKSPATADNFYAAGTTVQLTAAAPTGYCFSSWTGLTPGTPSTTSVSMVNPYALQANFQSGALTVAPATFRIDKRGGTFQINVSATAGCTWTAVSNSTWLKIISGSAGTGSGVVTFTVEAKNGKRTGQIRVASNVISIVQQ